MGILRSGSMEALLQLLAKQQVQGPQLMLASCPASKSLFFPFSLTEGANLGWIWRSGQEHVFVTQWVWFDGHSLHYLRPLWSDSLCMFRVTVAETCRTI